MCFFVFSITKKYKTKYEKNRKRIQKDTKKYKTNTKKIQKKYKKNTKKYNLYFKCKVPNVHFCVSVSP